MQKTEQESAKPKRKETVPYHNAAYSAFMCLLSKEIKSAWNLHKNDEAAAYWIHVMGSINGATLKKIISEEDGMEGIEYVVRDLAQEGFLGNLKQEWAQQGMQEGMRQLYTFLAGGHSLEEAKKKFAFA